MLFYSLVHKLVVGGLMVSALNSESSGLGSRHCIVGDNPLYSWARHFIPTVPLSTQVYKWVPANLMLGVTIQRGLEILLVASCYRNRDKLRPDRITLTLTLISHLARMQPLHEAVSKNSNSLLHNEIINQSSPY